MNNRRLRNTFREVSNKFEDYFQLWHSKHPLIMSLLNQFEIIDNNFIEYFQNDISLEDNQSLQLRSLIFYTMHDSYRSVDSLVRSYRHIVELSKMMSRLDLSQLVSLHVSMQTLVSSGNTLLEQEAQHVDQIRQQYRFITDTVPQFAGANRQYITALENFVLNKLRKALVTHNFLIELLQRLVRNCNQVYRLIDPILYSEQ